MASGMSPPLSEPLFLPVRDGGMGGDISWPTSHHVSFLVGRMGLAGANLLGRSHETVSS